MQMFDLIKRLTELDLNSTVVEGAKPDFLDLDKDGNKKEPMKKAASEKKVGETTKKATSEGTCSKCDCDPCKCDNKVDEGSMKDAMWRDAERMSREQFCSKWGDENGDFWDNIMGDLDEGLDVASLRYLAGVKNTLAECGMMPGQQNATFSINASAPSGDEVAGMLSQIMNLAGVKSVGHADMPSHDSGKHPLTAEPSIHGTPHDEKEVMRSTMDLMNPPEDEGMFGAGAGAIGGSELGGAAGAALGNMVAPGIGGAIGGMAGKVIGGGIGAKVGDAATGEDGSGPDAGGPVAAMADEIRDMADELSQVDDKDELNVETYDNTPADPNKKPEFDSNKLAWNPNAGGHGGNGLANNPRAMSETLEDRLLADYQAFVSEGTKTMSRAAKGNEKYGKEGMKALAKAGREGKDLDKVRDKFDKYDEATEPKDLPKKGQKMGKEGNAFGKAVRDAKASGDKSMTVGNKTMSVK